MLGISESLAADLSARGYTESDVARLFGPLSYRGEVSVVYARPNGDRTSPLPSSLHRYYTSKGFTAVEVIDPVADAEHVDSEVPEEILEYGRNDKVGIWRRESDEIESSCRNAKSLLSRNWTFAGLADEDRRRAVAEARPISTKRSNGAIRSVTVGRPSLEVCEQERRTCKQQSNSASAAK